MKFNFRIVSVLAAVTFTFAAGTTTAQEFHDFRTAAEKPKVAVLGTWHWGETNDSFKAAPVDYRSPERKAQTEELFAKLAAFEPTKILLEYEPELDDENNAAYRKLRDGTYPKAVSERFDVGMALAAKLGHERVWGVDHQLSNWDMNRLMKAAQENGQAAVLQGVFAGVGKEMGEMSALTANGTILDVYRFVNDSARVAGRGAIDLVAARIGSRKDPAGLDIQGTWYVRNLHIFANVMSRLEPGDRALILIGSAHKPTVELYLRESGQVDLVDINEFLK